MSSRMAQEVSQTPKVVARFLRHGERDVAAAAAALEAAGLRWISFVARGTSDHVARYGRYLVETTHGAESSGPASWRLRGDRSGDPRLGQMCRRSSSGPMVRWDGGSTGCWNDFRATGARPWVIGGQEAPIVHGRGDRHRLVQLPVDLPTELAPAAFVIPGQFLAEAVARARHHDADRPVGLTKVTRTH